MKYILLLLLLFICHVYDVNSTSVSLAHQLSTELACNQASNSLQPSQQTCCFGLVCPHANGVCCSNGRSCCPAGSKCLPSKLGEPQTCGIPVNIPMSRIDGKNCQCPPPPKCTSEPCPKPKPCNCQPAPLPSPPNQCGCLGQPKCGCAPNNNPPPPSNQCACLGQPKCGCAPNNPPPPSNQCACLGQPKCGCAPNNPPPPSNQCGCLGQPKCGCAPNNPPPPSNQCTCLGQPKCGCDTTKVPMPDMSSTAIARALYGMKPSSINKKVNSPSSSSDEIETPTNDDKKKNMHKDEHWNYKLNGADWTGTCATGLHQSPILIEQHDAHNNSNFALETAYLDSVGCKVENTGHNIQVTAKDGCKLGSAFSAGVEYEVLQIHFHQNSEHRMNGEQYAMECHVIHRKKGSKGLNDLLVLAVLFKSGDKCDSFLDSLNISNWPLKQTQTRKIQKVGLGSWKFLKEHPEMYGYEGSLTTPPCSETVSWRVMAVPATSCDAQRAVLRTIFPQSTARKPYPLGNRYLTLGKVVQHIIPSNKTANKTANHTTITPNNEHKVDEHHWDYKFAGGDWTGTCASGTKQSPVLIEEADAKIDANLTLDISYTNGQNCTLFNNGHSLQVNANEKCQLGMAFINTIEYEIKQLHFHQGSEHRINSQQYPLEMHIVHQKKGSSGTNDLLVVAYIWEASKECDPFLDQLKMKEWPLKKSDHVDVNVLFGDWKAIASDASYFAYDGSLTTPPCSETVTWRVLQSRGKVCDAQRKRFREVFPASTARKAFPMAKRKLSIGKVHNKSKPSSDKNKNEANKSSYPSFNYKQEGRDWPGRCNDPGNNMQSPIFIHGSDAVKDPQFEIKTDFHAGHNCKVINAGYTLQINSGEKDCNLGSVYQNNDEYVLRRIEFHTRSEHRIDGENFPLEMELLFQKKGAIGAEDIMGIAYLFELSAVCNPWLDKLSMSAWPLHAGTKYDINTIDLSQLTILEDGVDIWHYEGSLTVPPCTSATWNVLTKRGQLCPAQLKILEAALPGGNSRNAFKLGERKLVLGNMHKKY